MGLSIFPGLPEGIQNSIDYFFDLLFGGVQFLGFIVHWQVVKVLLPILLAILVAEKAILRHHVDNPEVAVLGDVVDVYVQSFFSASAEGGKLAEFSTLEGLGLRNSRFDAVWIET